jgi:hypothetical protein
MDGSAGEEREGGREEGWEERIWSDNEAELLLDSATDLSETREREQPECCGEDGGEGETARVGEEGEGKTQEEAVAAGRENGCVWVCRGEAEQGAPGREAAERRLGWGELEREVEWEAEREAGKKERGGLEVEAEGAAGTEGVDEAGLEVKAETEEIEAIETVGKTEAGSTGVGSTGAGAGAEEAVGVDSGTSRDDAVGRTGKERIVGEGERGTAGDGERE